MVTMVTRSRSAVRFMSLMSRRMSTSTPAPSDQHKLLSLANGHKLAYHKTQSSKENLPTIIYVPGFMSGKDGNKAKYLDTFCKEKNLSFIRYDPTCIGESPGCWETLEFKDWIENAREIVDNLGSENQNILIGSSMGGWITLWLASQPSFQEKIKRIILIAPGLNFLRPHYQQILKNCPEEIQKKLESGGVHYMDWNGYERLAIRKSFSENSKTFEIDLEKEIPVKCPVQIFHGVLDESVPYQSSLQILSQLVTKDAELVYRKDEGHSFTEERSLELLKQALMEAVEK